MIGSKFGRLTIVSETYPTMDKRGYIWDRNYTCKCECGGHKTVRRTRLLSGHTSSCGCIKRENILTPTKENRFRINRILSEVRYHMNSLRKAFEAEERARYIAERKKISYRRKIQNKVAKARLLRATDADYRAKEREWVKASYLKNYHKPSNRRARARANSLRNKRHRQATPSWLSKAHKKAIADTYIQSSNLSNTTGVKHHVDHIVPLRGYNVCGLHVPWNLQVITATENIAKSNKIECVLK